MHLGADARLVTDPDDAAGAAGVVLPGVGAFGRCAQALRATGPRRAPWTDALERGVPFLGICVGFQLLYEGSEESPGVAGPGRAGGHGAGTAAGGEAPADAVEPARDTPRRRQRAPGRAARRAVGVLRPLVRARSCPTTSWRRVTTAGRSWPRRSGARCGARSSTPRSPARWVSPSSPTSWPRAGTGVAALGDGHHGALPRHRPARRRRGAPRPGRLRPRARLRRPRRAGPLVRRRRGAVDPRRGPRRGAHRGTR